MSERAVDVAIIGGGVAGLMLARQLRRTCPGVEVAVFDRRREPAHKVGEATVEISTNYLLRKLGLSTYLYERQLPKNGLRYFFDTEGRDAALTDMSEIGSRGMLWIPSFLLDRPSLERDLAEMNRADGVAIFTGARVDTIELADGGGPDARHTFTAHTDGGAQRYRCRWLVDASGRAHVLGRKLGLRREEPHGTAAAWGWMQGVVDVDSLPDPAFHARVNYTARTLSTIHFCYPGYWVWMIRLRGGLTSVGVVSERDRFDDAWRKPEGFKRFLESHRALGELVAPAEIVQSGSFGRLAYGTERYMSANRWCVVGDAASFTDPFYSPGLDFVALENDMVTDLIARDHAGLTRGALQERCDAYDAFMQFRYRATMMLYRDLYSTLGSYELFRLKLEFDLLSYYNLWVHSYMLDQHLDLKAIASELRRQDFIFKALENFTALFQKLDRSLRASGRYHAGNLGGFDCHLERIDFLTAVGTPRKRKDVMRTTHQFFNQIRGWAFDLLDTTRPSGGPPTPHEPIPLYEFMLDAPLA